MVLSNSSRGSCANRLVSTSLIFLLSSLEWQAGIVEFLLVVSSSRAGIGVGAGSTSRALLVRVSFVLWINLAFIEDIKPIISSNTYLFFSKFSSG